MELGDLYPAVITLVLIGVILGIGIYTLNEIRTNVATVHIGTDDLADVNGTGATSTNTTTLSDSTKDDYVLQSITSMINQSLSVIPTSNYSFTTAGVVTFTWDLAATNTEVNINSTYIFDATGSPEKAINDTLEGIGGFSGWIAIIVIVIAAAIVLGLILRSFSSRPGV